MIAVELLLVAMAVYSFVALHSSHCPGRRWSLGQHEIFVLLVQDYVRNDDRQYDFVEGQLLDVVGRLASAADDMEMHYLWVRLFTTRGLRKGDGEAEARDLIDRSAALARKAERCHFKFLPTSVPTLGKGPQ
jgi:hypothetical protein